MQNSLLWKLLGIYILVIGMAILTVWLAIDYLAADYFMTLMKKYEIDPTDVHQMFLEAVHRYLIWASLAALVVAFILSFFLTRRVLTPLFQMANTAKQIGAGNYTVRVPIPAEKTMGQFAQGFNHMAESLQKLERQRKTMMIDVAHELRTPLTNMRGYLEALSDKVIPPSQEMFELLQEETMRLVTLTEDLLQLARAEAARITLKRHQVNLHEQLGQSLDLFRSQFNAKDIQLKIPEETQDTRVRSIMADPDKLTQILHNLLQNALQYTPQGGSVGVRIDAESDEPKLLKVSFHNTGEGIAEQDLPYIFERFYRAEKSRSREHGGEGIGLAIVKELVEAHGGQVGAESDPTETCVWFTIPV